MKSVGKKLLRGALFIVIIAVIIVAVYLGNYYHTQVDIDSLGNSKVSISNEDYGYFIDGPGTESALIFYPGAKVDEKAYGPLMSQIAAG